MRQSELVGKTLRHPPKDEESKNARLLIQAGYVHKEMAGVYSYLPLGLRVLNKIAGVVREEMDAIGGQEVLLTTLQDPEPWKKSGRWDEEVMDVWFKTQNASGQELGLANTHEEPLTRLLRSRVSSYKDLPLYPYQIQTKLRNELRAKSGILRGREFLMKDLYSFSASEKEHEEFYEKAKQAYWRVFERLDLRETTVFTWASGGSFSEFSHEFQTLSEAGEDTVYLCSKCRVAVNEEIISKQTTCPECGGAELEKKSSIEVGNIFPLGTKYAEALGLSFTDEEGEKRPAVMGSYGIGISRAMGVVAEAFADEKGLVWPEPVSPFKVHLVSLQGGEKTAERAYGELSDVLYDDREEASAGEKFADADLLGIPWRAVASEKTGAKVELKRRGEEKTELVLVPELKRRFP